MIVKKCVEKEEMHKRNSDFDKYDTTIGVQSFGSRVFKIAHRLH